ncbi:MAG: hypothetical protein WD646_15750 [Actinomycetota bacterium]
MTRTPPRHVTVHGAAKINVGWRVGARRSDGHHEVSGLLQTISLTDRLAISTDVGDPPGKGVGVAFDVGAPISLRVDGPEKLEGELESTDNLVCRAAKLLAERAEARPTAIALDKKIPVAAGLGGGSADAAAALVGLNTVWAAGLSASRLVELGAEIGSDVPAMLIGGLVHASGRGSSVRRVGSYTEGWVVLGIGAEHVSAAESYEAFDGLEWGRDGSVFVHHNDLQRATIQLVPALRERLDAMQKAAGVAFMSGSGPTVVGVVETESQAHDVRAQVGSVFERVLVAQPVDWGVHLFLGAEAGQ